MGKFKVGDRVKTLATLCDLPINATGVVTSTFEHNGDFISVDVNGHFDVPYLETELELVDESSENTEREADSNEGVKHDAGKPMVSLIPVEFILGVARVFTFGAKKYGRYNFRAGMDHSRVLDALGRHYLAIVNGEDIDPESNEPHWAHLGCCIAMYAYYKVAGKGKDDRYETTKD